MSMCGEEVGLRYINTKYWYKYNSDCKSDRSIDVYG